MGSTLEMMNSNPTTIDATTLELRFEQPKVVKLGHCKNSHVKSRYVRWTLGRCGRDDAGAGLAPLALAANSDHRRK
jgi:hypothetical protein